MMHRPASAPAGYGKVQIPKAGFAPFHSPGGYDGELIINSTKKDRLVNYVPGLSCKVSPRLDNKAQPGRAAIFRAGGNFQGRSFDCVDRFAINFAQDDRYSYMNDRCSS